MPGRRRRSRPPPADEPRTPHFARAIGPSRRPPNARSNRSRRAGARPCASRRRSATRSEGAAAGADASPRSPAPAAGRHRSRRERKHRAAAPQRLVVATALPAAELGTPRAERAMKSGGSTRRRDLVAHGAQGRRRRAIWRCASTRPGCSAAIRKLVLHGGGNTSLKTRARDLLGDEVEVLRVKASGADMAAIEPAGLPAVRLAPLRQLRALDAIADEDLVGDRARQSDRSRGAQSVGRGHAARVPAAQIRRPHPRDARCSASSTSPTAKQNAPKSLAAGSASCPT